MGVTVYKSPRKEKSNFRVCGHSTLSVSLRLLYKAKSSCRLTAVCMCVPACVYIVHMCVYMHVCVCLIVYVSSPTPREGDLPSPLSPGLGTQLFAAGISKLEGPDNTAPRSHCLATIMLVPQAELRRRELWKHTGESLLRSLQASGCTAPAQLA